LSPLFSLPLRAEQFVHLTAEIELTQWHSFHGKPNVFKVSCVVGTNSWQMDCEFLRGAKSSYWFTGTKLVEIDEIPRAPINPALANRKDESSGVSVASTHVATPNSRRWKSTYHSRHGNPGRGVGESDRLSASGRIAWLAFCSGPCLKREGRRIYPPSDFWKEYSAASGWLEKTEVFKDALGLPSSVLLCATNGPPILTYRVTASTNVLGWQFPLAFNLTQYLPNIDHGSECPVWKMHLTARGKVTAIGVGTEPRIPTALEPATSK
jgi:hypothetical protein